MGGYGAPGEPCPPGETRLSDTFPPPLQSTSTNSYTHPSYSEEGSSYGSGHSTLAMNKPEGGPQVSFDFHHPSEPYSNSFPTSHNTDMSNSTASPQFSSPSTNQAPSSTGHTYASFSSPPATSSTTTSATDKPKRLHVTNIPFRFREPDLRHLFFVSYLPIYKS